MALIVCPECGKTVSDQAESCPRCGLPSPASALLKRRDQQVQAKTAGLARTVQMWIRFGVYLLIAIIGFGLLGLISGTLGLVWFVLAVPVAVLLCRHWAAGIAWFSRVVADGLKKIGW